MNLLSRDDILGADDLKTEDVDVPEWGGVVRVKSLMGSDRDRFEQGLFEFKGNSRIENLSNARAQLVSLSVVDESGAPLFTYDDAVALGQKSARALDRVFAIAQRLGGISDADVEDYIKNFASGPNADSTSA